MAQRQYRIPATNIATREQASAGRSQEGTPETERYLLQIDRQSKRAFKTLDDARSAALEIKARFPALQVSVYDSTSKSRTVVDAPKLS